MHETTAIESAEFFMKETGTLEWTQPFGDMLTSDGGRTYFAFLVGLDAGIYDYYIAIEDVYHNTGFLGNETHPLAFEVTGHLAWQQNKTETYQADISHQLITQGNLSDGTPLIYNLELDPSGKTVYLNKYLADGSLDDSYGIDFTGGFDFRIGSGLFDEDSILDPVAIVSAGTSTIVYVLHGANFTLYHSSISPVFMKSLRIIEIIDGDSDGRDELYQLRSGSDFTLGRMDDVGTWTWRNLTNPNDSDLRPEFMIGAESGTGKANYLTIIRGQSFIEIVDGSDINSYSAISIPTVGFSGVQAKTISTFKRTLGGGEEFALGMTFWSGPIPETRLYLYNGTAQNLGDLDMHTIANRDVSFLSPFDADLDGIDELVILHDGGELMLARVSGILAFDWTIHVSESTPLSAIETDFNGWSVNEFLL
ncbi:MAG: hypothetical protein ACXABC_13975, partial [Candidatus Thorarchaeota archaeon]